MKPIYIFWTCANLEEARVVSLYLVKKKWVACSSIIPGVESIFCFNGKIETEQEVKVFFKQWIFTMKKSVKLLEKRVVMMCLKLLRLLVID